MRPKGSMLVAGLAVAATLYVIGNSWISAQRGSAQTRVAAVPGVKGGQDMYGPYDSVADWPKDLSTLPGHEGWTFGAGQSVFAESPNRIFVLQRGELPKIAAPRTRKLTDLGPSIAFPIGPLPQRDATTANPPGNRGDRQAVRG